LGIQEPASVLASLLNLAAHIWGLSEFRKRVPSEAPLYWFWHVFATIAFNGWICSAVFHARDKPWTEIMDYMAAFSMVIFSFFSVFVR
jgi:hypothetical protein